MTTETKINNLVKKSDTETLIMKLKEIFKNNKLMKLNIAIQEELENRIGEDKLDSILDAIR